QVSPRKDGRTLDHFGPGRQFPTPPLEEEFSDYRGIKPPERHAAVGLDGEPPRWRLYPVGFAKSPDLMREGFLFCCRADMLDHAVAESDVELPVGKPDHVACIANNATHGVVRGHFGFRNARQVENDNFEPRAKAVPELRFAAQIQYGRSGCSAHESREELHPALPGTGGKGPHHGVERMNAKILQAHWPLTPFY